MFKGDNLYVFGRSGVWLDKNFNIGIFSVIINVINVKLYMMALLKALNLVISLSMTLTIFQNHGMLNSFN